MPSGSLWPTSTTPPPVLVGAADSTIVASPASTSSPPCVSRSEPDRKKRVSVPAGYFGVTPTDGAASPSYASQSVMKEKSSAGFGPVRLR